MVFCLLVSVLFCLSSVPASAGLAYLNVALDTGALSKVRIDWLGCRSSAFENPTSQLDAALLEKKGAATSYIQCSTIPYRPRDAGSSTPLVKVPECCTV